MSDIRWRATISSDLSKIDFIVFSGDVTYHAVPEEYQVAVTEFFEPLLIAAGVRKDRLFIVPGNHDLEMDALEMQPDNLLQKLSSSEKVNEWLTDKRKRQTLLAPMANYSKFVTEYIGKDAGPEPAYGYTCRFETGGKNIAIIGLNSAWLSARNRDAEGKLNDRGYLILGEPQVYASLAGTEDADIRIAVVHHPFEWLTEFDQHRVQERVGRQCHFVLRGHQHLPQVIVMCGTAGDCVIIPAGASYNREPSAEFRYANAYNFVSLDYEDARGVVYLRRWSERQACWQADTDSWDMGQFTFNLPKRPFKGKSKESVPGPANVLDERLEQIVQFYLSTSFERDQYARLDQAGETDPDRTTLLRQVFVDLEVRPRNGPQPRRLRRRQLALFEERERVAEDIHTSGEEKGLSAMDCFLQEMWPMIVLIGGPGHGKSTLGQYLAQIHRATILRREEELNLSSPESSLANVQEFIPKTPRIPFRIILKYLAQWLAYRQ